MAKVLVADDDPNIRLLLQKQLELEGYKVITAAGGESAIALARRERPDLVLLDLMMPDIDGLEVCRTLRQEMVIPIIMLTAKGTDTDKVVGLTIGADEYIMTVAHGATDVLGVGNTNYVSELNIWYHTLNAGFRTQIGGETDWPCINGENVGRGRSYAKVASGPNSAVSYQGILEAIDGGNSYVSDGRSHLMNFKVEGQSNRRP